MQTLGTNVYIVPPVISSIGRMSNTENSKFSLWVLGKEIMVFSLKGLGIMVSAAFPC
jgi:hypothetical protein